MEKPKKHETMSDMGSSIEFYYADEMDKWLEHEDFKSTDKILKYKDAEWRQKIEKLLGEVDEGDFRSAFEALIKEEKCVKKQKE